MSDLLAVIIRLCFFTFRLVELKPLDAAAGDFLPFFEACNLSQYVAIPAHGYSILDINLSDSPLASTASLLLPLPNPDHKMVQFNINANTAASTLIPMPVFIVHTDYTNYLSLNRYLVVLIGLMSTTTHRLLTCTNDSATKFIPCFLSSFL